jgi:hypothetical protein
MTGFDYVDIHRADDKGQHYPWKRVKVDQVPGIVSRLQAAKVAHIYTTIQRYDDPEHKDNEVEYCPLPFDFDCADNVQ